jgi:hypothetical protein
MGVLKFPKLGLLPLWGPIILCADLQLRWSLKQNCIPHWKLSNRMWHTTYTQGNWGDSWLLVVGSQIDNLTSDHSFGHNLCFKCPNKSCEPILNIYFSRVFQWYKELLNPMSFGPCNCLLKIQGSVGTQTPKVEVHLGVWGFILSHFFALPGAWNVSLRLTLGPHLYKPLPWSRT